ncbi:PQQ-dependent dehydrogenase, methanol/ethanol family [bacterium]|nr:PQQ-dependent dehydrogenase, methanol/ethanol family [bacterium]
MRRHWKIVMLAILWGMAVVGCSRASADVSESPAPTSPPVVTAAVPLDTDWPLHGLDFQEQRYSSLEQINRSNVEQLELAWSFDMYTRRGIQATPLMVDGTLYVSGSWSMVYALDARSGKLKWFYDPQVDRAFLAKGCCGAVNRGVAYKDGKVIVGTYDGRLVALNAGDGSVVWDVQTTDREQSYTITGAPRIAKNKVLIGNGGAEMGVRGYVSAYDIETGEMAWRFYTVPGNPADGFENEAMKVAAATWTGKWWEWGGGGTVWDSMVYDPQLDLLYIGVGNGTPHNQNIRSPEGGDNLFLSSIVALRPDTGEYVWHYQTTPGDTWDFTATQHMILADLEIGGTLRKVLMQAPKNGFFYVIDRVSGQLISAIPYTPSMTWATHVDKATGRPVETPTARVFDGRTVALPSTAGAHNWPPMSYNPGTGLVYIPTMIFPMTFLEPTDDRDRLPRQGFWNVGFDRMSSAPPKVSQAELNDAIKKRYSGSLIAWDPLKGEARWVSKPGRPDTGGTLSTAGGLVFNGGGGGHLIASDAASGEKLWSRDTQTGAWGAPITYALDGEQYIAVAVGHIGTLGAAAHGWKMPNLSRVLVYKLGGTHSLPPVPADNRQMPKPGPVTADAETQQLGQALYQRHCGVCHGDGLRTAGINPDLRWSSEGIHAIWQEIVRGGILKARGMVSFSEFLSAEEAEAIRQYVLAEANRLHLEISAGTNDDGG